LHREWEAAGIVDYASSKALVAVDGYIENAEQWILDNAPKYMDDAKKSLVENAPKIRGYAEDWAGTLADDVSSRVHDAVSEQVRDVMKEHSKEIREALDAAGDVQKSEAAEYDLQKVLEAEFEQTAVNHVDRYLPDLLRALQDMDAKMKLYVETAPAKLTEDQQLEREFVMIINTVFERGFGWARQKYPVHVGE
jgi:RNA processing factor Prp31